MEIEKINTDANKVEEKERPETMLPINNFIKLTPFVDRYFCKYYNIHKNRGMIQDHYAFQHTNKLVMVGLSKRHHLITSQTKISKIEYPHLGSADLSKLVVGKKKRGGMRTKSNTVVCSIICEDGQVFMIKACIGGSVIEVNERIMDDPTILLTKPETQGYICLINPTDYHSNLKTQEHLISSEKYATLDEKYYNDMEETYMNTTITIHQK